MTPVFVGLAAVPESVSWMRCRYELNAALPVGSQSPAIAASTAVVVAPVDALALRVFCEGLFWPSAEFALSCGRPPRPQPLTLATTTTTPTPTTTLGSLPDPLLVLRWWFYPLLPALSYLVSVA